VRDMSVEDLGTRELGQVRSQRLDEVSFLPFSVSIPSFLLSSVSRLLTHEQDVTHCIRSKTHTIAVRMHSPMTISPAPSSLLNFNQTIF
jgi:hypothetical protein